MNDRKDPSTTSIAVIRHGRTASNVRMAVHCHTDIPLDEVGRDQAAALAASLVATRERPIAIASSPLSRAMETARILGAQLGLTPVSNKGLLEIDLGEIDGFTVDDLRERPDVLSQLAGEELDAFVWPGGEGLRAFHQRVADVMTTLAREASGPLAVVTHGGVVASLLAQVRGESPHPWLLAQCGRFSEAIDDHRGRSEPWPGRIENCSVTRFVVHGDGVFPTNWEFVPRASLPAMTGNLTGIGGIGI